MRTVGVIGLGDMGLGIARNLVESGFPTVGFDIRQERMGLLEAAGGLPARSCSEVGRRSDAVFVMVLNGDQAREALLGSEGAVAGMAAGSTVIVTATLFPREVRDLEKPLAARGIDLVDSPVSGGKAGADDGSLTLMTAARPEIFEANREVLEAISGKLFHVGEEAGQGQTVKAALQVLIGCTFAGTFEALVLGAKAGVQGKTLFDVIRASSVDSPLFETCARNVLDRHFDRTGSHIRTMRKDLGIATRLGGETGVLMLATTAARAMFDAGFASYPDGDNWVVAKFLEEASDTRVEW